MASPQTMKLIIYTDGAARGNPGLAAYGFTVADEQGRLIIKTGRFIGIATNNVAEYSAVLAALSYVKKKFRSRAAMEIAVFADSLLVTKQLSGQYKLKNPHLKLLFMQIKQLEPSLGRVFYNYIPRSQNKLADLMANLAIDRCLSWK